MAYNFNKIRKDGSHCCNSKSHKITKFRSLSMNIDLFRNTHCVTCCHSVSYNKKSNVEKDVQNMKEESGETCAISIETISGSNMVDNQEYHDNWVLSW